MRVPPDLPSFPTRRSSDLAAGVRTIGIDDDTDRVAALARGEPPLFEPGLAELLRAGLEAKTFSVTTDLAGLADADVDRKSTRLNSSHLGTSYAVFCLKKKR